MSTALFKFFPKLGACILDSLCRRFLAIETKDCFIDLDDAISAVCFLSDVCFPFSMSLSLLFSFPDVVTLKLLDFPLISLIGGFAVWKGAEATSLRWLAGVGPDLWVTTGVDFGVGPVRGKDLIFSPHPFAGAVVTGAAAFDVFLAGFIVDGGLQRGPLCCCLEDES
jgi:hypothetical protein